jgi:hypothetical protein
MTINQPLDRNVAGGSRKNFHQAQIYRVLAPFGGRLTNVITIAL